MTRTRINLTEVRSDVPAGGLSALHEVVLWNRFEKMLELATTSCNGPAAWRARKCHDARELLALVQVSGRMQIRGLSCAEALRAMVLMDTPVPCRDASGELQVFDQVLLGLTYCQEALSRPQPGFSFVQILAPDNVWHANVGPPEHSQPLCLGEYLPAAIELKEIVLMTYGALSMQSVMFDEQDPAGVLNADAARWWQQNRDRIPLSREPFIRPRA